MNCRIGQAMSLLPEFNDDISRLEYCIDRKLTHIFRSPSHGDTYMQWCYDQQHIETGCIRCGNCVTLSVSYPCRHLAICASHKKYVDHHTRIMMLQGGEQCPVCQQRITNWTLGNPIVQPTAQLIIQPITRPITQPIAQRILPAAQRYSTVQWRYSKSAECPICLSEYEPSSEVSQLPCGHGAHHLCLSQCLQPFCPLCRSPWA